MKTPFPRSLCALAAVAGALALPALASADSVVYIDGGNVWTAHPDGGGKVQLTDGGNWHDPTQSDDGTIAAVKGTDTIQFMAKDGKPLHTMTTKYQKAGDGSTFAPHPVDLALSPDGKRLAYSYVEYSCSQGSTCGTIERTTLVTESSADVATDTYGSHLDLSDPSWVTNDRVMTFGGFGHNVNFLDLGANGPAVEKSWFTNEADTNDGEFSPDHSKVAIDFFYGDQLQLLIAKVPSDPNTAIPAKPSQVICGFTADAKTTDPTWAPDNKGIAFGSKDGVQVARFTNLGDGQCAIENDTTTVLSATGSEPDWGPADPAATRYVEPKPTPVATTTPVPVKTVVPTPTPDPVHPIASISAGGKSTQSARKALHFTCTGAGACTVTVKAKAGKKTYTAKGTGTGAITVKFTGKAAKAIKKAAKKHAVPATATFTALGAAPATKGLKLTK